jgi:uncharacterized protein
MTEELSKEEIRIFLQQQYVCRVGCCDDNRPYVVPNTFFYDSESSSIICHTGEGKQLKILRKNPHVCIEIGEVKDLANWKSVIVIGSMEELSGSNARNFSHKYLMHLKALAGDKGEHVQFLKDISYPTPSETATVMYKVNITQISGRCSKSI